ncbi:MAG: hypothetical protein U0939_24795 [Pirellulales bacterium]
MQCLASTHARPVARRVTRRSHAMGILLLSLSLLAGCTPGQKLVKVQIQQDGRTVLETMYGTPDDWKIDRIWMRAATVDFEAVDSWGESTPTTDGVILQGKVRVVVLHVSRTIATADLSELRLVETSTNPPKWRLGPGETERAARFLK